MLGKSTMPDTSPKSRRSKFVKILRRMYKSRPISYINGKRGSNRLHRRRKLTTLDMSTRYDDVPRQHQEPISFLTSSAEDCSSTPIAPKKANEECTLARDKLTTRPKNDNTMSNLKQSNMHKEKVILGQGSLSQGVNHHFPVKLTSQETSEDSVSSECSDKVIARFPNCEKSFEFWAEIPYEIAISIFRYLTPKELIRMSIVCRRFQRICYDGQLWMSFDTSKIYKEISAESLTKIIVAAGPFVRNLNLRGCIQVEHYKRAEVVVQACHNLTSIALEGCRNFQQTTLHFLLRSNVNLVSVNLIGLKTVTNATCEIIANNCHRLELLDISGCSSLDTRGVRMIVRQCRKLKDLRSRDTKGWDCIRLAQDIFEINELEKLIISGCSDLTDQALRTMMHGKDPEIDFCTNVPCVPMRKLRYLDISRCYRITDFGIKSLAYLTCNLQGLLLSNCLRISDEGLRNVLTNTPRLLHLDLEDVHLITNKFMKHTLATASCASSLRKLSLSCCDQLTDEGVVPLIRSCINLRTIELDNTSISDLTITEAIRMLRARYLLYKGQMSKTATIGLQLAVYDCMNVTWAGIRQVICCNAEAMRFIDNEVSAQITELIELKCYYCWQLTVNEHTQRLLRGDQQAALKLETLWAEWMIAHEENQIRGSGTRRRRRRARVARIHHDNEQQANRINENRQSSRAVVATAGCTIM